jgi:DNA repair protein RecO (recombination protein O)
MDEQVTGLILRTRPLTETSLIVHWLTAECGRIATVAKGARRPKSPFQGKLDLFYRATFSFHRRRLGKVHLLREVRLLPSAGKWRLDLDRLKQAAYGCALLEKATETDTPLPTIFELFTNWLGFLETRPVQALTVFTLELKLLEDLGLAPPLDLSPLTAGSKAVLRRLLELDWPELDRLKVAPAQLVEIGSYLKGFITQNLEGLPRGREAALALPMRPG